MKESEALELVNNLIVATQKARSIMNEMISPDGDEVADWVLDIMFPYSYGDDTILPTLLKISEREFIEPQDLYNILTLIDIRGMEIEAAYVAAGFGALPERQLAWLTEGWEQESVE